MEPLSLQRIRAACAGELLRGSPATLARRVCTDSREARKDDLFIALEGERFDGHAFVGEVAARGAAAVTVNRSRIPAASENCAVITVENTRRALGQIAADYRRDFALPIIAVAGSNGKTTTKELIASVLRERLNTLWSQASFNNDIGVPLTLLSLERAHQAAVLEVGTNHPGELAPLVRMIQPRYGVITSIGREHLEFFGDLKGVAQEEGTLAELLPEDGKLFLNGDTAEVENIVRRSRAPVVRVGMAQHNDWRAANVRMNDRGVVFNVLAPRRAFDGEYQLSLLGRHQVTNALLAAAAGAELGLTPEEIRRGLLACAPAKMRMQLVRVAGVQLLDDCYNANADSMRAALDTLRDFPCAGRRVAVLGDMAELGSHAESAHMEVGRYAAELGLNRLFAIGKMAGVLEQAAREAGLREAQAFPDVETAARAVRDYVRPGDVVLLKASRAARLERLAEVLRSGGVAT